MRTFLSFKWVVIALIAAMLVFGVTRALLARSEQQAQAQIAAAKLQEPTVFKLSAGDVMTAENGTLDTTVTINGTVQALNSATLKSNMAGTVEAVWVREGQVVQAGQALVQLDTNDARARATQAQQQTKAAKAQLALAERQRNNNQTLVDKGFISSTALASSDTNFATALANLDAAIAAQGIAQRALDDTTVRAPFAGQVTQRYVKVGERLTVNAPVMDVVDVAQLEIEIALTIAQANHVRLGQVAHLHLESSTHVVNAAVTRINAAVQASTRSVLAYLSLPPHSARVGEFATGLLTTGQATGVLVPRDAILNDQPVPYVQAVSNGLVKHIDVALLAMGRVNGQDYAVVTNVLAGDTLLSARAGMIAAQTAVHIAQP